VNIFVHWENIRAVCLDIDSGRRVFDTRLLPAHATEAMLYVRAKRKGSAMHVEVLRAALRAKCWRSGDYFRFRVDCS
jgi:hypothetical protein